MICEREEEVEKFVPQEYWTIDADFVDKRKKISAKLMKIDGAKPEIDSQTKADKACSDIKKQEFTITSFKKGSLLRQPPPPYITSALQQDAFSKLGFGNKKTMSFAQQLYEGVEICDEGQVGLITYMRTDSYHIANEAIKEAKEYITTQFGKEYIPSKTIKHKARKAAQQAHEAIRPTSAFRDIGAVKKYLSKDQFKLYQLIWSRFLASQMAPAEYKTTTVEISGGKYLFKAYHQEIAFDGFTKLFNNSGNGDDIKKKIPQLQEGMSLKLSELFPEQHFTQPPPRFNSGSLVKELEEKGIGRPSTYAQIITTLSSRKYVQQDKRRFQPTDLGKMVNKILVENFPDIFNTDFTAAMEDELDNIELGKDDWVDVLNDFYKPFIEDLKRVEKITKDIKKQTIVKTDEVCDKCSAPMVIKFGRNGRFLACSSYPDCKNTKPLEGDIEKIDKKCPNCGAQMEIRQGRFGRFIACSNYPECKTTEKISTGVKCPTKDCDGELIERTSRRGIFYSCSRYPDCKYAINSKPVSKQCPACGHSFMVEKSTKTHGDHLYCTNCKHRLIEEKEAEKAKA